MLSSRQCESASMCLPSHMRLRVVEVHLSTCQHSQLLRIRFWIGGRASHGHDSLVLWTTCETCSTINSHSDIDKIYPEAFLPGLYHGLPVVQDLIPSPILCSSQGDRWTSLTHLLMLLPMGFLAARRAVFGLPAARALE